MKESVKCYNGLKENPKTNYEQQSAHYSLWAESSLLLFLCSQQVKYALEFYISKLFRLEKMKNMYYFVTCETT